MTTLGRTIGPMIESAIPIGATARRGDVELGLTWLLVGADWMVLDHATRGIAPIGHLSLTDDRGSAYSEMGSGACGDKDGLLRHHTRFREALDPRARELQMRVTQHGGGPVLEATVPITERVPATALDSEFWPAPNPPANALKTCFTCGRAGEWVCNRCRDEGLAIAGRRSKRLVPERMIPIPAELDRVAGVKHALGGILVWERTFSLRFVFEPASGSRRRLDDPPRPLAGRWTAQDATGRTFIGGGKSQGLSRGEGRELGDAEIEFMPELDLDAGPLLVRNEAHDGTVIAELELPLTAAS